MPSMENDYSPILRSGTLEKPSGLMGRRKLRQSIPNAGFGEELVLIQSNGVPVNAMTAGERYWGSSSGWVIADVSDHHLTFLFSYRDTDGLAGYNIAATVLVAITDAAVAVRRKGLRQYVEPALQARVAIPLNGGHDTNGEDTVSALNRRLDGHQRSLSQITGQSLQADSWFTATITQLSIMFDNATQAHHDELVRISRTTTQKVATIAGRQTTVDSELKLFDVLTSYYGKDMPADLMPFVRSVAAHPTPENIRELAERAIEDARSKRSDAASLIVMLAKEGVIVEVEDIATAMGEFGLRRDTTAGRAITPGAEPFGIADKPAPLDATVADAHIVDDGSGPNDDLNWDD